MMIVRMSAEAITRAMLMMPSRRVSPQRCNDIHSVLPIHHRRSPQPPRPPRNNSRIIENKMTVIVGTCKQQAAARGNSETSIIQHRTLATTFQLKLSPTGYALFGHVPLVLSLRLHWHEEGYCNIGMALCVFVAFLLGVQCTKYF